MIPSLFVYELKMLLRRMAALLVMALLLGMAVVFLFDPEILPQIRQLSEELPLTTRLMGYSGSANLPVHVLGLLYGLLMPLVLVVSTRRLARRLITLPLEEGRMAQRLAAPHRRAALVFTLFFLMMLETLLICLAAFLGQAAGVMIFLKGQGDLLALLRLALGMALSALPLAGAMAAVALASPGPVSARRWSFLLGLMFLGFMVASRLSGWAQLLRFGTSFALFKGQALLTDFDALLLPALGLPLAFILAGLGALAFSGRDL